MLETMRALNAPIKELRQKIWEVEAKVLELEKQFIWSEAEKMPMLDFRRQLGIGDSFTAISPLGQKIKLLKSGPLYIRLLKEFDQLRTAYIEYTNKLFVHLKRWDEFTRVVIDRSIDVFNKIRSCEVSTAEKINLLAEFDCHVILKMLLPVLQTARTENEADMQKFFFEKTGRNLAANLERFSATVTVERTCNTFVSKPAIEVTNAFVMQEMDKLAIKFISNLKISTNDSYFTSPSGMEALREFLLINTFLIFVNNTIQQADALFSGNIYAKVMLLFNRENVVNTYANLHRLASHCRIHKNEKALKCFHDFIMLMMALHQESMDALPPFVKSEDGSLLPLAFTYLRDDDDRNLDRHISPGLNKITISCHQHSMAKVLSKQLTDLEDSMASKFTCNSDSRHTLFWQAAKRASTIPLTPEEEDSLSLAARRGIIEARRFVYR